jgi:hypothetical protein
MALKDLNRDELEAKALRLGVDFTSKTSDIKLRKRCRIAMKALKREKLKATSAVWPKAWASDMREEYYAKIVGKPMPPHEEKAYAHLLKVIDERAAKEKIPQMNGKEPDCFGLYFAGSLKSCMTQCPHMPLCKRIVETRPELQKLADELDNAADEVDKLSDKDREDLVKASTKKTKTKKDSKVSNASKPKRVAALESTVKVPKLYVMFGRARDYVLDDKDLRNVYVWMESMKSRGFTRRALIARLYAAGFEEPESLARETLDWLMSEGDVRVKRDKRKS